MCVCVLGQHAGHVFVIKLILSVRQSWVFTWSKPYRDHVVVGTFSGSPPVR